MDTFAQLPAAEREPYFQQGAAELGLAPHVIEKDFWVCWTLKHLFELECVRDNLLFKGGTSLSKVHGLIRRFSEDIDLSIHRGSLGFDGENDPANPDLSNKARKRQDVALAEAAKTKISSEIQPELEAAMRSLLGDEAWSLAPDLSDPDGQSLAFTYPITSLTPGASAYLKPAVKIEFGARSDHWPAETLPVQPYLSEAIEGALDKPSAEVKSMKAERTFWEKATILHQMAHLAEGKTLPSRYSRHYCDLAAMIEAGIGKIAAADESLLTAVVEHKMTFYRSAWASYETATRGTLRLVPADERVAELEKDLKSMNEMFFDDSPKIEAVLDTLRSWEADFNQS